MKYFILLIGTCALWGCSEMEYNDANKDANNQNQFYEMNHSGIYDVIIPNSKTREFNKFSMDLIESTGSNFVSQKNLTLPDEIPDGVKITLKNLDMPEVFQINTYIKKGDDNLKLFNFFKYEKQSELLYIEVTGLINALGDKIEFGALHISIVNSQNNEIFHLKQPLRRLPNIQVSLHHLEDENLYYSKNFKKLSINNKQWSPILILKVTNKSFSKISTELNALAPETTFFLDHEKFKAIKNPGCTGTTIKETIVSQPTFKTLLLPLNADAIIIGEKAFDKDSHYLLSLDQNQTILLALFIESAFLDNFFKPYQYPEEYYPIKCDITCIDRRGGYYLVTQNIIDTSTTHKDLYIGTLTNILFKYMDDPLNGSFHKEILPFKDQPNYSNTNIKVFKALTRNFNINPIKGQRKIKDYDLHPSYCEPNDDPWWD